MKDFGSLVGNIAATAALARTSRGQDPRPVPSGSALVPFQPRPHRPAPDEPSAALTAALAPINGPVRMVEVERPDGRRELIGRMHDMPTNAAAVLPEARARLKAVRAKLAEADGDALFDFALVLAAATEKTFRADAQQGEVMALSALLYGMPEVCIMADVPAIQGEEQRRTRQRRIAARVRELLPELRALSRDGKPYWPSYGLLEPILKRYSRIAHEEEVTLAELIARLDAPTDKATPDKAPATPAPDDGGLDVNVAEYIDQLESQPADNGRRTLARMFRTRLQRQLTGAYARVAARLDPLCDAPDMATVLHFGPRPIVPPGAFSKALSQDIAQRHAATRAALLRPDDELARLQAEATARSLAMESQGR